MGDNNQTSTDIHFDYKNVLNSFGDAILIFDATGKLVFDSKAAAKVLGNNLELIRSQGWTACAMLINTDREEGYAANLRAQALSLPDPVRFSLLLAEEHLPAWISRLQSDDGQQFFTMITISKADWSFFSDLMKRFRDEAETAIDDTRGHADLIIQIATKRNKIKTVDQLAERVTGFASMMSLQMLRLQNFVEQVHRIEDIRTGQMAQEVQSQLRKTGLADFIEDYLEELADKPTHDIPEEDEDVRDRIEVNIPDGMYVNTSRKYLTYVIRDVLKNALMYSPPGTPIKLHAISTSQGKSVQLDITDQGYGIREKEMDRVFKPFMRARQPQIIAEFGYGLSLYLAKANIEAMGGKIWFKSQEGISTTFTIILPAYQEEDKKS